MKGQSNTTKFVILLALTFLAVGIGFPNDMRMAAGSIWAVFMLWYLCDALAEIAKPLTELASIARESWNKNR